MQNHDQLIIKIFFDSLGKLNNKREAKLNKGNYPNTIKML